MFSSVPLTSTTGYGCAALGRQLPSLAPGGGVVGARKPWTSAAAALCGTGRAVAAEADWAPVRVRQAADATEAPRAAMRNRLLGMMGSTVLLSKFSGPRADYSRSQTPCSRTNSAEDRCSP